MNLQELKYYIDNKNLATSYTSPENSSLFVKCTTSTGIDGQTSWKDSQVDARWWIDYDISVDEFIFKINCFQKDGSSMSKEEFNSIMPRHYAGIYGTESNIIKWVRQEGVYSIRYSTSVLMKLPINTIIRLPIPSPSVQTTPSLTPTSSKPFIG